MKLETAIRAFLDHLRLIRRIAPTSEKTYRAILNRFKLRFEVDDPTVEISASHVDDYLLECGAELGDHAFNKAFQVLRSFFAFSGLPVLTGRPAPIIHETPRRFLREVEIERLLKTVADRSGRNEEMNGHRDHALLSILYFALLRVGEAVRLRREDVDIKAGELLVLGKGGRQRRLPLCERLREILSHWLSRLPSQAEYLFPSHAKYSPRYGQLDNCRVERLLRDEYAPAAGLQNVTPHTLRRSAANILRQRGVDLATISELLGHRDLNTTRLYLGVSAQELREGVRAFDNQSAWKHAGIKHERHNPVKRYFS